MRVKSFQSSYSKLFLVTEDVYNRLHECISDKTEEDELRKLNGPREGEISSENLTNPESNLNSNISNQIHQKTQIPENTDISLQTDVEGSPASNETEEGDKESSLQADKSSQTEEIDTKDVFTETSDEISEKVELRKNELDTNSLSTEVNSKDLYHKLLGSKINKTRKHRCFICLKYFASNYSKNRHIKRIHKGLEKGKISAPLNESNSGVLNPEQPKSKVILRKAVKRKNLDVSDVTQDPIIPQKRSRLSQGMKRKKEENDKIVKRVRFQDWN